MVLSFRIPSSITSEEPSISNNSLCCSSDTSSAVWQQQKTITPQWHSHCTDICKEKQHPTILGPVTPNWAASLYPCARSHESGFALPHFWFLFWGDSLGGFPFTRFWCFTLCRSRQSFWRCFHLITILLHKCVLLERLHWDWKKGSTSHF